MQRPAIADRHGAGELDDTMVEEWRPASRLDAIDARSSLTNVIRQEPVQSRCSIDCKNAPSQTILPPHFGGQRRLENTEGDPVRRTNSYSSCVRAQRARQQAGLAFGA